MWTKGSNPAPAAMTWDYNSPGNSVHLGLLQQKGSKSQILTAWSDQFVNNFTTLNTTRVLELKTGFKNLQNIGFYLHLISIDNILRKNEQTTFWLVSYYVVLI